ncbi:aspartate aminotransferase family protein [Candidatus Peregrinibacteria bacterium]|nr:aspartate aminotransferase family protein [Candidatus Peregrinibacteria bacterium]
MLLDFENRIIKQRKKLHVSDKKLISRVEKSVFGPKSKKVLKKTVQYESSGQIGFAVFKCPPVIEEGAGSVVVDADGKEYIDLLSGFSVSSVGQCNPEVVQVIKDQCDRMMHYFDLPNIQRAELAKRISELAPGNFRKKVLFAVTGADAVDNAIKLSRWYTGGQFILTFYGDYHGVTGGTMGLTGKGGMWSYYYPILPADSGIAKFPYAYCYRCLYGMEYPNCELQCVKSIESLLEGKESPYREPKSPISNVAAVIVEPMQSSAGYIIPPDEFLAGIKRICEKFGFLFVSDEIQAGLGRTGKMWAIEHSGVIPDMITTSKALADGIPISMVVGRKEILESWGPGAHVSTFAGSHLACAAANKVLQIMTRKNFLQKVRQNGKYFLEKLLGIADKHPIIGHVNGKGLYLGIEFVRDRKTKEPADKETNFMMNECLKNGVIFEMGGYYYNRFQLIPSLLISKEEIDRAVAVFDKVFGSAEKKFDIC